VDLTRTLRLRITFGRNPACLDTGGTIEHWRVEVYEVTQGTTRYPYSVEAELDYVDVCPKWYPRGDVTGELERFWGEVRGNMEGGMVCIAAHREYIPGVHLTPTSIENFHRAIKLARERALMLSGYMTAEELVTEEDYFEGAKWNSPKLKKAKPQPTGKGVEEGRQRVRALLSGHVWNDTDTPVDEDYYRSMLGG
jgi:hypothetical protein